MEKPVIDVWHSVFYSLIACLKVIDTISYYEIRDISEDLNNNLREILEDILIALFGEGIITAKDLLIDKASPINYHKIKNTIRNGKFEKSFKEGLIQKIENWDNRYINSEHYEILTERDSGIAFLRDKVFAHTDSKGLFYVINKVVIDNLKKVIADLYKLHRELLIELSNNDDNKKIIASTQPTSEETSIQSKRKATLLKNMFNMELN